MVNKEYDPKTSTWRTKVADVSEKGEVVIAVNAFNNEDSDGDISVPGSFKKTLTENFPRVKWFLNHNRTQLLGVPIKGEETPEYLQLTAQFNMKKQMSLDTLEDYKLYAEYGKTLEHSVGVDAILRDKADPRKVIEWKLWEFSTLTSWGANDNTPLLDLKSMDVTKEQIEFLQKALQDGKGSDERLIRMEKQILILTKAAAGEAMVTCPECGHNFDYNECQEHTLEQQVLDICGKYAGWMIENIVYQEMQQLRPEVQAQVEAIMSSQKEMKTKGIENFINYVRCPNCWARVYKSNSNLEPDESTQEEVIPEETKDEGRKSTFTFKSIGGMLQTK